VNWTAKVDSYKFKYPIFEGNSSSFSWGHEARDIRFFFPDIEADEEALRFDYADVERRYNGFGKLGFSVGIENVAPKISPKNPITLGYRHAYHENLKYGIAVYFSPNNFGETEKVLYEYRDEEYWDEIQKRVDGIMETI
jgi:hypothetical protein